MKICVYAIAKNERENVVEWLESARDADYIVLMDTGSADGTLRAARKWMDQNKDVQVILGSEDFAPWSTLEEYDTTYQRDKRYPWRFDMARNHSMELIPDDTDVCVCLDLDEILCPGWREAIEAAWTPEATTGRYEYVWNHRIDGSDGVKYLGEKVHRYPGVRWVGAVHEVLKYRGPRVDVMIPGLRIEHYADDSKSRANYLPMLELAVREDPDNDRNTHYLGREYYFRGMYDKAVEMLKRHLELPSATWDEERAASMRYIGRCMEAQNNRPAAEIWYSRAADEAPAQREPLIEMARMELEGQHWKMAVARCEEALRLTNRPMTYMCDPYAWGEGPWDIMSVALWYLGKRETAVMYCRKALELAPNDERIKRNLAAMTGGADG